MNTRFTIITIPTTKRSDDISISEEIYHGVQQAFHDQLSYAVDQRGKINCLLNVDNNAVGFNSLEEAKQQLSTNKVQIIVQYNEENRNVIALHENYFAGKRNGDLHKTEMSHLYMKSQVDAQQELDRDKLNTSIVYGYLKELVNNNAGDPDKFTRGIGLGDYLFENPPEHTYGISKKVETAKDLAIKFFKDHPAIKESFVRDLETQLNEKPEFPVINLDNFNEADIRYALEHFGSFELVGTSINDLKDKAEKALAKCKEILQMPEEVLEKSKQQKFHGFQNVRKETTERNKANPNIPIRNQIAEHYKPYIADELDAKQEPNRLPEGVDMAAYRDYYENAHALMHTLYRKIAILFNVDQDKLINYLDDRISVLTTRKYFEHKEGETGIPPHSDYGLLTLIVSDKPGLEVERDGRWIGAPAGPGLRFFVNFGDWFGFLLKNIKCTAGYHRVDKVEERHMLAFFLNPDPNQRAKTPLSQGEVPYIDFLMSDKTKFMNVKKVK